MKCKKILGLTLSLLMMFESAGIHTAGAAEENRLPAFPGAEGGGMYTQGARAAQEFEIYHVTNLNSSGRGSFSDAVSRGNRIIVFDVSGIIHFDKGEITASNLTILGQTAPGEGVCIAGSVTFKGSKNVIVRYMRFRPGSVEGIHEENDALGGRLGCENIIIDHCSMSWSEDEVMSWYGISNFTAQWNILSEPLNDGGHGYAGLWGGTNASFHHNLLASCYSRNPRIATTATVNSVPDDEALIDVRNNVIYNWGTQAGYGGENGVRVNLVNNYYRPAGNVEHGGFYQLYGGSGLLTDAKGNRLAQSTTLHIAGNVYEGSDVYTNNNWSGITMKIDADNLYWIKRENIGDEGVVMRRQEQTDISVPEGTGKNDQYIYDYPVTTQTAEEAYNDVLLYAGASFRRDVTDERIVKDVINKTFTTGSRKGSGFIDSHNDVGGWCLLDAGEKPVDTDGDGIPDEWEDANGLDKNDASDAVKTAASGYTNIEEYANALAANPESRSVDRIALNLAIKNIDNINDADYLPETAEELHKAADEAKQIFGKSESQSEIDDTAERLKALLENALINYRPVLESYIEEVGGTDTDVNTLESAAAFASALEKAGADLEADAENEVLKQDYDELKAAYEGLEESTRPRFLSALSAAKERLADEKENPLAVLRSKVSSAEALIAGNAYTNESLDAASDELEQLTERAKALDDYLKIAEIPALGEEYFTEEFKKTAESAKKAYFDARASETADADEVNAAAESFAETYRNAAYIGDWKNVIYSEDFESGKEYALAETVSEDGNTYVKPQIDIEGPQINFEMTLPTEGLGDVFYISTDFRHTESDGYSDSATDAHNYVFGDTIYSVIMFRNECVRVLRYDTKSPRTSFADAYIPVKYDEWENLTSRYDCVNGELRVYLNNACVYSEVIADGEDKRPTELNIKPIVEGGFMLLSANMNNALDNIMIYGEKSVETGFIYGDADADGELTAADSAAILQKVLNNAYTMPIEARTGSYMLYTDVDGEEGLTAADSAAVLQKVLNSSFKMPVENG